MIMAVALGSGGCHRSAIMVDRNTPDASVGGDAGDAGAEAPDPGRDFRGLLGMLNDAFYGKWSACFDTPRELWPSGDFSDLPVSSFEKSLQLGLMTIDPEAARQCLEVLMAAPCDRIAEIGLRAPIGPGNVALPECAGVLAGQVPPGRTCRINEDCQTPEQYACVGGSVCGRICTARTARAAGDLCSVAMDQCPDGTVCRFGPNDKNDERCLEPTTQGGACRESDECGPGLMCAQRTATSIFDGTCRPLALGSPCAGNWECAYSYVCADAGPDNPGTCQVGKHVGATCATYLQDVNRNLYSDCAPATSCLDLDGNGPRCIDGAPLGAPCGTQTGPYSGWLGCLEGYCNRGPRNTSAVGTCEPKKPAGSECNSRTECTPPNECLRGADGSQRCGLPNVPAPLGSPCNPGLVECGPGQYCALPASFDPDDPSVPTEGSCAPVIPVGQACRAYVDLCEGLAECVESVCKRC
jgi:hypothetical protein